MSKHHRQYKDPYALPSKHAPQPQESSKHRKLARIYISDDIVLHWRLNVRVSISGICKNLVRPIPVESENIVPLPTSRFHLAYSWAIICDAAIDSTSWELAQVSLDGQSNYSGFPPMRGALFVISRYRIQQALQVVKQGQICNWFTSVTRLRPQN